MRTRQRSGAIIKQDGRLLLIKRRNRREDYYIVPGGGVEEGETPECAAERELFEELGIRAIIGKKIIEFEHRGGVEHYYLVDAYHGDIRHLGDSNVNQDIYDEVVWVHLDDLPAINLLPTRIHELLNQYFRNSINQKS